MRLLSTIMGENAAQFYRDNFNAPLEKVPQKIEEWKIEGHNLCALFTFYDAPEKITEDNGAQDKVA